MRASQLVCASLCGSLLALVAGACSDSDEQRAAATVGGAAGEGASASGGSEGDSGGAGGTPGEAGSGSGGAPSPSGGAGACPEGPEGDPPADYLAELASGTRLEARYFAAAGLPQLLAGFFDTELGDWCDFMIASDDKLRCLPRGVPTHNQGYSSATCDGDDVLTLPDACASASAVYLRQRLECLDKAGIWLATPYAGAVYQGSPGNCSSAGAAPANSYAIGNAVAATAFVEGTLVDLPGVCRGSLRVVEGEDGARGPFEAFDIASGAGCDHGSAGCRPQRRAFEEPGLFSDDACETPAAESYATWNDAETCTPPDFVRPATNEDFWYRAGPLTDVELYSGLGGCLPARERDWIGSIYEIGEAVPSSDFAPLVGLELGSGRLRADAAAEAGTPLIAALGLDDRFFDSELGTLCFLRQLDDGSLRCIPSNILGGSIVDEYNDADCTQPLRRCVDDGSGCADQIRYDDPIDPNSCTSERPVTGIWRLTAAATGYFRESPGFPCYAAGDVPQDAWLVEPVAPAELPEATLEAAP